MTEHSKAPPGWGDDPLSQFIHGTTENTYATFYNLKEWYKRLNGIHVAFSKAAEHMDRPPDFIATIFLFRSHSAYLAGVRLALSGQVPEANMVLRGSLECALYGLYVARKPSVRDVWLRRDENDNAKNKVKNEFKVGNLFKVLDSEDHKLRETAEVLYERTIEYGGHPNMQGCLSVMKKKTFGSKDLFQSAYMIGNDSVLKLCLKSSAQIGTCALSIIRLVFRERFDILGISNELKELKKGL